MEKYDLIVLAYVIMPNHFQAIADEINLKKALQYIKAYSAKEILDQLYIEKSYNIIDRLIEEKCSYKVKSKHQYGKRATIHK